MSRARKCYLWSRDLVRCDHTLGDFVTFSRRALKHPVERRPRSPSKAAETRNHDSSLQPCDARTTHHQILLVLERSQCVLRNSKFLSRKDAPEALPRVQHRQHRVQRRWRTITSRGKLRVSIRSGSRRTKAAYLSTTRRRCQRRRMFQEAQRTDDITKS